MIHDRNLKASRLALSPGLWYLRSSDENGFELATIIPFTVGPFDGRLGVWVTTQEGNLWADEMPEDAFIGMIPEPVACRDPAVFVPHDQITPGFWYIRVMYAPYYDVAKVYALPNGELEGICTGAEFGYELDAYGPDQFIGPIPPPGIAF